MAEHRTSLARGRGTALEARRAVPQRAHQPTAEALGVHPPTQPTMTLRAFELCLFVIAFVGLLAVNGTKEEEEEVSVRRKGLGCCGVCLTFPCSRTDATCDRCKAWSTASATYRQSREALDPSVESTM